MIVINLFAGPGAGKSTTAAGLFYKMKKDGLNVELVSEYAKDCVWDNSKDKLNDQLYVFAKQNHKLERLRDKVDFVITDSPILLSLYYGEKYSTIFRDSFKKMIHEVYDSYININLFIQRTKEYNPIGRLCSYENAIATDKAILELLSDRPYSVSVDDDNILDNIYRCIGMSL